MKKYTNKILIIAGILSIIFFVITFFLTYKELKNEGKLTTYEELGISDTTITVDEDGNTEEISD